MPPTTLLLHYAAKTIPFFQFFFQKSELFFKAFKVTGPFSPMALERYENENDFSRQ